MPKGFPFNVLVTVDVVACSLSLCVCAGAGTKIPRASKLLSFAFDRNDSTRFAYITYGNSETCNKSLFEPIQMHRRCSMLMDSSNRIRLSNHHIVYLNYAWERIVNSSLSIRSEVFCEKLSI